MRSQMANLNNSEVTKKEITNYFEMLNNFYGTFGAGRAGGGGVALSLSTHIERL